MFDVLPGTTRLLEDARGLIANPQHWNEWFLQNDGKRCALGAINYAHTGRATTTRAGRPHGKPNLWVSAVRLLDHTSTYNVDNQRVGINTVRENNNEGHAAVMTMFDKAIAIAREHELVPVPTVTPVTIGPWERVTA